VVVVASAGLVVVVVAGQGGPAARLARVLRRRLRVFGGSPAAARRWFSSCRVFQAARMRWLRTASRVVTNSMRGVRPMRRHQPRAVLLCRLGEHVRRDGEGLLCAAGLGVLGGLQDFRAVPVQSHRRGAVRAADLAHGGRALDPVVAVGVVSGEAAELVAGGLGGLRVMRCGLLPGRARGEGPRFQQRRG